MMMMTIERYYYYYYGCYCLGDASVAFGVKCCRSTFQNSEVYSLLLPTSKLMKQYNIGIYGSGCIWWMNVCMYGCMYIYVCMVVCDVCKDICMYVSTHVCM